MLKQVKEQMKGKDLASSTPPSSTAMGSSSSPPPPQPPKESLTKRYKFIWRLFLAANLAIGAYTFVRPKGRDTSKTAEEGTKDAAPTPPITEKPLTSPPITEAAKLREPIPVNQQCALFKWMLEEKRKIKPKDHEEKKKIDEEKAILKQFIRAKSIPSI